MRSLMLYSCTCMQALDMIGGKNVLLLMDSHLEGNFSTEEATVLVGLASQCLQYEPRDRPNLKNLVATLVPLNTKPEVSKLFSVFLFAGICFVWCYFLQYIRAQCVNAQRRWIIYFSHVNLRTIQNILPCMKASFFMMGSFAILFILSGQLATNFRPRLLGFDRYIPVVLLLLRVCAYVEVPKIASALNILAGWTEPLV